MAELKTGWIKLHRSILDWEWWDDHNATRMLIFLLVSVNYEQKKWMGQTIEPGQLITSWDKLSENTGMTVRQCRTSIEKLEKSDQITRKTTNKWQAITLLKWDKLQGEDSKLDKPATSQRQTNDKPATTTKEGKELKESKEVNIPSEIEFLDFCKSIEGINFLEYEFSIKAKYEAWVDNGWKDGNRNAIKNWKTKIKNTIPFLKPIKASHPEKKLSAEEEYYNNVMAQVPDHYKNKDQ